MAQADGTNFGQRRNPPGATMPEQSIPWAPMTIEEVLIDSLNCQVNPPSARAVTAVPTNLLDHHDGSYFTAWNERLAPANQQLRNALSGHRFVTDARRNNVSVAALALSYRGSLASTVDLAGSPSLARHVNVTRGNRLSSLHRWKRTVNKCNEFVADILLEAGYPVPEVPGEQIASARDYAMPTIQIVGLSAPMPVSMARPGDVIAQDHTQQGQAWGHVGIVVGPRLTASANAVDRFGGQITVNDWGFRQAPDNGEPFEGSPPPVVRRLLWRPAYPAR